MTACPVCGREDVIFTGQSKYEVEGRPTALCPHAEAHARAGAAARSIRFFSDTGEVLGVVKQSPAERLYAAGVPMGIEEEGLRESLEMLHTNPNGLCPKSLGWILHRHEKTVAGDHYIERHTAKRKGSRLWIIQAAASEHSQAS